MFAYGFAAIIIGSFITKVYGVPLDPDTLRPDGGKINVADWIGGALFYTGALSLIAGIASLLWKWLP